MKPFSKYLSPKNYARFALGKLNVGLLQYLETYLAPSPRLPLKFPPIFIIGAPRSGSTLLFQVLSDDFDVGYLSNIHCQFFGFPVLVERLFRLLHNRNPSDFQSIHGVTKGMAAPSECGEWWYRFFRRDPAYVTIEDAEPKKMGAFRQSLLALSESAGRPLLFKNLYASLRLEPISKYVPEALFIVIKRDVFFNAASILAGRKQSLGSYNKWWSVPPPRGDNLRQLSPCEQVVGQIRCIYEEIARVKDKGLIPEDRILLVEYEELCHSTHNVLSKVDKFLVEHGIDAGHRHNVPESFSVSRDVKIEPELSRELKAVVKRELI